jgi:hypothetical protein
MWDSAKPPHLGPLRVQPRGELLVRVRLYRQRGVHGQHLRHEDRVLSAITLSGCDGVDSAVSTDSTCTRF